MGGGSDRRIERCAGRCFAFDRIRTLLLERLNGVVDRGMHDRERARLEDRTRWRRGGIERDHVPLGNDVGTRAGTAEHREDKQTTHNEPAKSGHRRLLQQVRAKIGSTSICVQCIYISLIDAIPAWFDHVIPSRRRGISASRMAEIPPSASLGTACAPRMTKF